MTCICLHSVSYRVWGCAMQRSNFGGDVGVVIRVLIPRIVGGRDVSSCSLVNTLFRQMSLGSRASRSYAND
jgi:hypothetical protein